jgi:hypothetical protein
MKKPANSLTIDLHRLISSASNEVYMLAHDYVQGAKQAGYYSLVKHGFLGDTVRVTYPFPGDHAAERADWLRARGVPAACLEVSR